MVNSEFADLGSSMGRDENGAVTQLSALLCLNPHLALAHDSSRPPSCFNSDSLLSLSPEIVRSFSICRFVQCPSPSQDHHHHHQVSPRTQGAFTTSLIKQYLGDTSASNSSRFLMSCSQGYSLPCLSGTKRYREGKKQVCVCPSVCGTVCFPVTPPRVVAFLQGHTTLHVKDRGFFTYPKKCAFSLTFHETDLAG